MIQEKITIGTKYPLEGILTIPENGETLFPAVVLVHGSGPNDMDEKIGNCYVFRDIAEGLAKRGIATIRYNKRTKTYGKQMVKDAEFESFTVFDETIEDAIFATDLLREDSRIDSSKIFIAGHSMGAMLAPRIDAEGGNYAGLILLAGSPRKLEEIIIDQQDEAIAELNPILKGIANSQVKKMRKNLDKLYEMSDDEAMKTIFLGKYNRLYYLKEWGLKPTANYLKDLQKPIILMQGDADFQVSVEKDFNKYKEILADKPNATFKLYPNLNHLFMQKVYGNINKASKEYKKPQHVEACVIDDIAGWMQDIKGKNEDSKVTKLSPTEILAKKENLVCECPELDCEWHGNCKDCMALHRYHVTAPNCMEEGAENKEGIDTDFINERANIVYVKRSKKNRTAVSGWLITYGLAAAIPAISYFIWKRSKK